MSLKRQRKILNVNSNDTKSIVAERLNKLCEFLDETYDINAGGCCFITYCLARLLKRDKFKFKVVIYDDRRIQEKSFEELDTTHWHYGILLGDYPINDGCCANDSSLIQTTFSKVNISDILEHYKEHNWNHCYNSEKNSFISKTLKVFYGDLTEDLRKGSDSD